MRESWYRGNPDSQISKYLSLSEPPSLSLGILPRGLPNAIEQRYERTQQKNESVIRSKSSKKTKK
jgi:hypothetical protein